MAPLALVDGGQLTVDRVAPQVPVGGAAGAASGLWAVGGGAFGTGLQARRVVGFSVGNLDSWFRLT